jgi:peptidyl-prolyl cis-trans isomerase D
MAGSDDDQVPRRRKGAFGSVVVWVLMAMLVIGLGGFGLTNFGGGQTSVGSVGDRRIEAADYARALQSEMRALSAQLGTEVTLSQAEALGLDLRVRERLVAQAALDNEAGRVGISAGDRRVADEILAFSAFQGVDGTFDRATYARTLERSGLTELGFEAQVRADLARSILQGAVAGGFVAPAALTGTLQAWAMERRGFTVLRLTEADLTSPPPAPTDADLQAWYQANPAAYTLPEARRITYAALLPEMLADDMALDEAALREQYQARIAEFVQPERRLVERLVFPDAAAAAEARARFDAGTPFETLVEERGLTLADIDLGEQSLTDLGAAGGAVFALAEPGVVGPLPSDFGPALYRMNGILAAQEVPFDEARTLLAAEQATEAARRAIAGRVETVNDLLAGGAELEDLAAEAGMQVESFDYRPDSDEPIAGYAAFQEAAAALAEGDFPEIVQLDDGGIVALRLDGVVPPALRPFDEVAAEVAAAWQADARDRALAARAEEIRAEIAAGTAPGAYGVADVVHSMTRDGFLEGLPRSIVTEAFAMAEGDSRVVAEPGFTAILRLDSIRAAPADDAAAQAMQAAIGAQAGQALAQDAVGLFTSALIAEAGVRLDDQAIAAIHAQLR